MSNFRTCWHGLQRRLLFLSSFPHSRFSTETAGRRTAGIESPSSMANYLVNTLGFSREQAISASAKSSKLMSEQNANSVLGFFRKLGFNETQIHNTVRCYPHFLNRDVEETLVPKIRALQELGMSGAFLSNFLASNPGILGRNLESAIQPTVELLKSILGSGEDVARALRGSSWLFSDHPEKIQGNVMLLQKHGLSSQRIKQFLLMFPRCMHYRRELLEESLVKVEEILGLKPDSRMFIYGIPLLLFHSQESLRSKYELFKSYGWSDSDVDALARKQPLIFRLKLDMLKKKLDFLMKELGYRPELITSHLYLLTLSLEKRILPRAAVFRVLKEKELTNLCFYNVICFTESRFVSELLLPHKDSVPEIYEAYVKRKKGFAQ